MRCELSSKVILPSIRRELVSELVKMGMKQKDVAKILGITPAAVTQYIKGKRAKVPLTDREKEEVRTLAERIWKSGSVDEEEICAICDKIQERILS